MEIFSEALAELELTETPKPEDTILRPGKLISFMFENFLILQTIIRVRYRQIEKN